MFYSKCWAVNAYRTCAHSLQFNAINYNWMRWFIDLTVESAFVHRKEQIQNEIDWKRKGKKENESILCLYIQVCVVCVIVMQIQTKPSILTMMSFRWMCFCLSLPFSEREDGIQSHLMIWAVEKFLLEYTTFNQFNFEWCFLCKKPHATQ